MSHPVFVLPTTMFCLYVRMTGFKLMVTLQSGCVIEILTLCRIHEIFFQKYHEKAKIHSFPTMYIKGGSSFGRN